MTVTDNELEILEENILEFSHESSDPTTEEKCIYLDDLETILSNFFKIKITL